MDPKSVAVVVAGVVTVAALATGHDGQIVSMFYVFLGGLGLGTALNINGRLKNARAPESQ